MSDVKLERGFWLAIFLLVVGLAAAMPPEVSRPAPASAKTRAFQFTYDVMVKDVPAGTDRLRVWIAEASSDGNPTVSVRQKQSSVVLRFTCEPEYGDRMLYAQIDHPKQTEYRFTLPTK